VFPRCGSIGLAAKVDHDPNQICATSGGTTL
jgi:hypothetical protein